MSELNLTEVGKKFIDLLPNLDEYERANLDTDGRLFLRLDSQGILRPTGQQDAEFVSWLIDADKPYAKVIVRKLGGSLYHKTLDDLQA